MKLNKLMFAAMAVAALVAQPLYAVAVSHTASAASGVVTNINPDSWIWGGYSSPVGTHGSAVIAANTATGGNAALLLDTPANESYIWAIKNVGQPLSAIASLSYKSQRVAGANHAAPALLLLIDRDGDTSTSDSFYTYYEPAYNYPVASTDYSVWNTWNIDPATSKFWSGATVGSLGGANGANMYTLDYVKSIHPNAAITSYRLNQGTGNTAWRTWVDQITVNGEMIADFELEEVVTNVTTGTVYEDLQSAVDTASAGDELRLNQNVTLASDVDITKSLTIDGNGKTITANFIKSGNDNNSTLSVLANDVTIKNVTLDGVDPATNQLHGINAYMVQNLLVDGVTAKNFRTGILYNGSTGTIQNVHTVNNIWHGINIDKAGANVNVLGDNTHTEPFNIYVDDDTIGITVNAPAYKWSRSGIEGRDNDRVYRKKVVVTPETPVTPAEPTTPQGGNDDVPVSGGSGAASSTSDSEVAVVESTTTTNESKDTEVLGTDESEASTSSAQDTKEQKHWSLVNVLLAGVAVVMSTITLAGVRNAEGRAKWLRILTIIPAVGAVITVLVVEDFTAKLGWINSWTLLFLALVIAQAILRASAKPVEQ